MDPTSECVFLLTLKLAILQGEALQLPADALLFLQHFHSLSVYSEWQSTTQTHRWVWLEWRKWLGRAGPVRVHFPKKIPFQHLVVFGAKITTTELKPCLGGLLVGPGKVTVTFLSQPQQELDRSLLLELENQRDVSITFERVGV